MNEKSQKQPCTGDNQYGDEISLIDLWLVLVHRKWLILVIFVLCFAIGVVYTAVQPVRYEYVTGIDLARLPVKPGASNFELLLSKEDIIDLLENVVIPSQAVVSFGHETGAPKVQINDLEGTYSLSLTTTAPQEEANSVKKFHEASVHELAKETDKILKEELSLRISPMKARSTALREQIESVKDQLRALAKRTNNDENEMKVLIFTQQAGDLRRELAQARLDLADAESSAQAIVGGSHGTTLGYLAVRSKFPVGPDKRLLIVLSLVLGCILGVFGAFLAEFFHKAGQAARQRI